MTYKYSRVRSLLRRKSKDAFNPNNLSETDFVNGVAFNAKYVGCLEIERPMSRVEIVAAMRRVRFEYRMKNMKKKSVSVRVSVEGVEVKNKKKPPLDQLVSCHPISRIFYVSHDSQDLKVFSYITSDDASRVFHCSVFKSLKKKQAIQVVKTIGRAFDVCHKLDDGEINQKSLNNNTTTPNSPNNNTNNDNDDTFNTTCDVTKVSTIGTLEGTKKDIQKKQIDTDQRQQQHHKSIQLQSQQLQQLQQQQLFLNTTEYFSSDTLPKEPNRNIYAFKNSDFFPTSNDYNNNPFKENGNNNNNFPNTDSLKSADKYMIANQCRPSSTFVMPSPITSSIPTSLDHLQLLTPSRNLTPLVPRTPTNLILPATTSNNLQQQQQRVESYQHMQLQQQLQLQQQQLQLLVYQVQEVKSWLEVEASKRIESQVYLESMLKQNHLLLKQLSSKIFSDNNNNNNNNIVENNNDNDNFINKNNSNGFNNYNYGNNNSNTIKNNNLLNSCNSTPYNNHNNNNRNSHNDSFQLNSPRYRRSSEMNRSYALYDRLTPRDKQEKDFFEILQRYNSICNNGRNSGKTSNLLLSPGNNSNNRYNNPIHPNNNFEEEFNELYNSKENSVQGSHYNDHSPTKSQSINNHSTNHSFNQEYQKKISIKVNYNNIDNNINIDDGEGDDADDDGHGHDDDDDSLHDYFKNIDANACNNTNTAEVIVNKQTNPYDVDDAYKVANKETLKNENKINVASMNGGSVGTDYISSGDMKGTMDKSDRQVDNNYDNGDNNKGEGAFRDSGHEGTASNRTSLSGKGNWWGEDGEKRKSGGVEEKEIDGEREVEVVVRGVDRGVVCGNGKSERKIIRVEDVVENGGAIVDGPEDDRDDADAVIMEKRTNFE